MKIAIIYNYDSHAVINLFGTPNRERYGLKTIKKIASALKEGGHQVKSFEGDKNIIKNLEEFMPTVMAGERPGLVFNLSYGVQGKARYTHVPGILEMLGVPYIGSSPDVHGIALDKVITKMILRQRGIPTPNFDVLDTPDAEIDQALRYPLIVKPRSEAVSFGLKIVRDEKEMREGVAAIYEMFRQPTLVEEYIEGREFNVGLLGNSPPEALPVVELEFGDGEAIFTYEDKTHKSGREITKVCPAPLDEAQSQEISSLAVKSFQALGCQDCARVDLRMDSDGRFYVLEVNSMASLGMGGSYVYAAGQVGLDYNALANKLVDVAAKRYFGTEIAQHVEKTKTSQEHALFSYLVDRRDTIEKDLKGWTTISGRTEDAGQISAVVSKLEGRLSQIGFEPLAELTNHRSAWVWQTPAGLSSGTLIVLNLDSPADLDRFPIPFHREPEWLHGEAVATSRGGIACTIAALEALRSVRGLRKRALGIFAYTDEGRGMRYSSDMLRQAAEQAARVLVMRPGGLGGKVITQRRGLRKYSISIEGDPVRDSAKKRRADPMTWFIRNSAQILGLSNPAKRLTVSVQDVKTNRYNVLMPHRLRVLVTLSYLDPKTAESADTGIREIFKPDAASPRATIEVIEERPPFPNHRSNPVITALKSICEDWKLPFGTDSSALPSAAGLIPNQTPTVCGFSPAGKDLFTPREAINRGELLQRSLLLALFLHSLGNGS
jgi:D-alanine-D-alanine ligase